MPSSHVGPRSEKPPRRSRRRPRRLVHALPVELTERLEGHLATFATHLREGLLAASTAVGLEVLDELMDAEVDGLAGPRGKHLPARAAYRHGSESGAVTLGGRRVAVKRPRVRSADGAVELPIATYEAARAADLLADGIVARMLAGLSTRNYPVGLEPVGEAIEEQATGTSHAAVSRRFLAATAERLAELLGRRLDDRRYLVLMLDGFRLGDHLLVAALGIDAQGLKVPLGLVEGTTENSAVVGTLLADLRDRGLDVSEGVLFVVDGGSAIGSAIRTFFGRSVAVHRCHRHKERNVLEHLPDIERPLVQRRLRAAWAERDPAVAEAALKALVRSLAHHRPGAAASLREGLDDTLTLIRLGIVGSLRRTLESTNPMESMIEIVKTHARRVKNWESGEMALRWSAAGMLAAEAQFRRVQGYRELPILAAALKRELHIESEASATSQPI
jgi:transposase-like protein